MVVCPEGAGPRGPAWVSQKNVFSPEGAPEGRSEDNPRRTVRPLQGQSVWENKPRVNPGLCFISHFGPRMEKNIENIKPHKSTMSSSRMSKLQARRGYRTQPQGFKRFQPWESPNPRWASSQTFLCTDRPTSQDQPPGSRCYIVLRSVDRISGRKKLLLI